MNDIATLATRIHNKRMEQAMHSASAILEVTRRILRHPEFDLVKAAHIEIKQRPTIDHAEVVGEYEGYTFTIKDEEGRAAYTEMVMLVFDAINGAHRFAFSGPDEFVMNLTRKVEHFKSLGVKPDVR